MSSKLGIELYCKRDDLLPWFLGGNKVRKNLRILFGPSFSNDFPEVLVTNGGAESNHARVCALMAAATGIECQLVLHGKQTQTEHNNGNRYFFNAAQAVTHYKSPDEILRCLYKTESFDVRTRYYKTIEKLEQVFSPTELYFGLYEDMFQPEGLRELSNFFQIPTRMDLSQTIVNSSNKDFSISANLRKDVTEYYSDVYDYCYHRFPATRLLWNFQG
jgi:hypothetical protein